MRRAWRSAPSRKATGKEADDATPADRPARPRLPSPPPERAGHRPRPGCTDGCPRGRGPGCGIAGHPAGGEVPGGRHVVSRRARGGPSRGRMQLDRGVGGRRAAVGLAQQRPAGDTSAWLPDNADGRAGPAVHPGGEARPRRPLHRGQGPGGLAASRVGRLELHCALVRRPRSGSYRKAELRFLRSLGDRFCPWLSIASPNRCRPGADQGYHGPGRLRSLRRGRLRRSGPPSLTVCSARGWDREVERHQAKPADAIRLLPDGKARRSSSDTLTGAT